MKLTVLFGSPRKNGNTAALTEPFLKECAALGIETQRFDLYDKTLEPCLGCMACQDIFDGPGCVQKDAFEELFRAMADCDVLVLASPIYSWYCTAPMKNLMDRAIYAGNKYYGKEKGPSLLAGKKVAAISTCGYRPDKGADLWREGLKRWCKHGNMEYLGMLCRRDLGRNTIFSNEETQQAALDLAQAIYLSLTTEEL